MPPLVLVTPGAVFVVQFQLTLPIRGTTSRKMAPTAHAQYTEWRYGKDNRGKAPGCLCGDWHFSLLRFHFAFPHDLGGFFSSLSIFDA